MKNDTVQKFGEENERRSWMFTCCRLLVKRGKCEEVWEREIWSGQFLSQVDERTVRLRCQRTAGTCAGASAVKKIKGREREREKRATRPSWWPWKNNFSNSLSLLYGCGQLQQHLTTEATPATHAVMAVAILAFSPPPSLLPIRYGSLLHSKPATRSSVKEKKKQKKKRNKNKCNLESDRYLPEFFKSTAGSWNKTNPWRYAYCCVRI